MEIPSADLLDRVEGAVDRKTHLSNLLLVGLAKTSVEHRETVWKLEDDSGGEKISSILESPRSELEGRIRA